MFIFFKILNIICGVIIWSLILYGLFVTSILPSIKRIIAVSRGEVYNEVDLKVYLDDERPCPQGWVPVHTYQSCIDILKVFKPTHLSLDHDLGEEKTGADVVKWIEEETFNNPRYKPPIITVHSANPVGRQNMERGIQSIKKILSNRG